MVNGKRLMVNDEFMYYYLTFTSLKKLFFELNF